MMKKRLFIVTSLLLLLAAMFTSCGKKEGHDKFTVTFEANGGSAIDPIVVEDGKTLDLPENPTLDGYVFLGWFTDAELTNQFDSAAPIEQDMTLYAKWEKGIVNITVTFSSNGGSTVDPVVIEAGQKVTEPQAPTLEGYTFAGWYTDAECTSLFDFATVLTQDTTLTAKWNIITFAVSFDVNEGSAIDAQTINYGAKVVKPETDPTKDGYKFEGWFADKEFATAFDFEATEIKADTVIYAKWSILSYKVTFNMGANTVSAAPEAQTIEFNSVLTIPSQYVNGTKYGDFYFAGWFTDSELKSAFDTTTKIKADITLYAKWSVDPVYTVKVVYNDGVTPDGSIAATKEGEYKVAVPSASKDGYTVAWFSDENCQTACTFPMEIKDNSVVIYAKWTLVTYTIKYFDGTTEITNLTNKEYTVDSADITLETPTKAGCTFAGWFEKADFTGNAVTKIAKGSTGNKTYYVKWNAVFTVTFKNGETVVDTKQVENGKTTTAPKNPDDVVGYDFDGWYNGETKFAATTPVTQSVTYSAKFSAIKYTISYFDGNAPLTNLTPVEYTVETDTITLTEPTKEHYRFMGWFVESDFSGDAVTTIAKGSTENKTFYSKWEYVPNTYKYEYEPRTSGVTIPYNKDGSNYQLVIDSIIPADVTLKAGDVVEITFKGSSSIAIAKLESTIVDNTQAAGWWKPIANYAVVVENVNAQGTFEETVTYTITEDQVGEGSAAHKVTLYYSGDADATLYDKAHDFSAPTSYKVDINEEKVPTAAYESYTIDLSTIFPSTVDLSKFMYIKLNVSFYDTEEKEVVYNYNEGNPVHTGQVVALGEGDWNPLYTISNITPSGKSQYDCTYIPIVDGLKKLVVQNAGTNLSKYVVNYIDLVPAETGAVAYNNVKDACAAMTEGKKLVVGYVMTENEKAGWDLGGLCNSSWQVINSLSMTSPNPYVVGEICEAIFDYNEDMANVDVINLYNSAVFQYVYIK